jgi:hypothetical protein
MFGKGGEVIRAVVDSGGRQVVLGGQFAGLTEFNGEPLAGAGASDGFLWSIVP